jgi:hypothetical protein
MKVIGLGCILLLLLIAARTADGNVDENPTPDSVATRQVAASSVISARETPIVELEGSNSRKRQRARPRLD